MWVRIYEMKMLELGGTLEKISWVRKLLNLTMIIIVNERPWYPLSPVMFWSKNRLSGPFTRNIRDFFPLFCDFLVAQQIGKNHTIRQNIVYVSVQSRVAKQFIFSCSLDDFCFHLFEWTLHVKYSKVVGWWIDAVLVFWRFISETENHAVINILKPHTEPDGMFCVIGWLIIKNWK